MKRSIFYIVALLIVSACGPGKQVTSREELRPMDVNKIIQTHQQASPSFETMASRVLVTYQDEKKLQSMTVSLRMQRDEKIWIKASLLGITIAKVLITPDRVSYYEKVSNTYFDGDFRLLSDWLGTDLDFDKAQAILLGQSIFSLDKKGYTSSIMQNTYRLLPKRQPENFIHTLFLSPDNFKVVSGTLSQPEDKRNLRIKYGDYQQIEGDYYPSDITINSTDEISMTKIEVVYKKIDLNVNVSFPFTIPQGYDEILLGR
ncbi:DUF4292 domain-containing protein [Aureitalea marina]|uniref:Type IV secretion system putative lipoprotein virB7 n=1 Tax=Aureitalea marina TaxID=930804 RepID=A0A2S7KSC7_9FLAO|nr:DUF4292 domain-containing protein [Aureitalea marina]PQB05516.1 hypothetical protein BST85_11885 [Aureitalea marina]